jgi:SAM-dependent methyltransferase
MLKGGIIRDGEIRINRVEWAYLNERYKRPEIIQYISDQIVQNNVPVPLRKITPEEALKDFQDLENLDCRKLWKEGRVFTKYQYRHQPSGRYIDISKVGNKASDYFHQGERYRCDSINAPSPYRTWETEKFRKNFLKSLWTMKYTEITSATLRQAIALRNYTASQFRPSAAKAVYQLLESRDVLDFSIGWGDRLAAFCATPDARLYVGCDPNARLFGGYARQVEMYGAGKTIRAVNAAAEDADFGEEVFDTAFTSPPYFMTERYARDENQSWVRYKSLDAWLKGFLFKALANAWRALKPQGHLALNVADVYAKHQVNHIVDPANDFISRLPRAEFVGCLGLRMMKRPRSAADRQNVYVEPVFVWMKGN